MSQPTYEPPVLRSQVLEFADAEAAVVDYLGAVLELDEGHYGVWFPKSSTELPPALPYYQVGFDGTPTDAYPVAENATVRVTVWTAKGKRTDAKTGAARARGFLLAHPGDDRVWNVRPGTGRLAGTDPNTLLEYCTFTVLAATRPTVIA